MRLFVAYCHNLQYTWVCIMATSIRHDSDFVTQAKTYAKVTKRSVPKQIEHWAEIGRIAEDNPDLSYEFIKEALLATAEIKGGSAKPYVRRKRKND